VSADLIFWYGFALKMVMTAAVVVITSVVVERSGPFLGALIGALPTAAGAAYTILALEHPPDFIAASAIGSVAINGAVAIFAATYALLAQRHGLLVSLGGAAVFGSRSRPRCKSSIGHRSRRSRSTWRSMQ
jgi:uncharacterized membrane protein (GlpM family)